MKLNLSTIKHMLAVAGIVVLLPVAAQAKPSLDESAGHCDMQHDGASRHGGMGPQDGLMGEGGPVPPFLHGIELTEAQRDAVFNILHNQAPTVRDQQKSLRKAFEALRALTMSDGKYDEAKSRRLAQEIADRSATLALLHSRADHDVYALLTPEQRKQMGGHKIKGEFQPAAARFDHAQRDRRAM